MTDLMKPASPRYTCRDCCHYNEHEDACLAPIPLWAESILYDATRDVGWMSGIDARDKCDAFDVGALSAATEGISRLRNALSKHEPVEFDQKMTEAFESGRND